MLATGLRMLREKTCGFSNVIFSKIFEKSMGEKRKQYKVKGKQAFQAAKTAVL